MQNAYIRHLNLEGQPDGSFAWDADTYGVDFVHQKQMQTDMELDYIVNVNIMEENDYLERNVIDSTLELPLLCRWRA